MNRHAGTLAPREPLGRLCQLGIVVRDMDRTVANMRSILGAGPIERVQWPPPRPGIEMEYQGRPGDFAMLLGFVDFGGIQVELIQPLRGESIHRDFLESVGKGQADNPAPTAAK